MAVKDMVKYPHLVAAFPTVKPLKTHIPRDTEHLRSPHCRGKLAGAVSMPGFLDLQSDRDKCHAVPCRGQLSVRIYYTVSQLTSPHA